LCRLRPKSCPNAIVCRFRLSISVPLDWVSSEDTEAPTLLVWDSGCEAMVWTEDGEPQQVRVVPSSVGQRL